MQKSLKLINGRGVASVLFLTLAIHRHIVRNSISTTTIQKAFPTSQRDAPVKPKSAVYSNSFDAVLSATAYSNISLTNSPSSSFSNNSLLFQDKITLVGERYFHTSTQYKSDKRTTTDHLNTSLDMASNADIFVYPKIERNDSSVEKIFDVDVADPYRYLEDPNADATKDFVETQNKITEPYLQKCVHRTRVKEILTANQDYKKTGCPFKRGGKYYVFMNSGLQPQSVLYQQDTLESEPKIFFDPNSLSQDGTVALSVTSFSPDGQYFAYGLSYSGSDWIEIKIRNVSSGVDLTEKLLRAKFTSIQWTHDNKGFFYAQYPSYQGATVGTETEMAINHSVYYHTLNTEQSEDSLKVNFIEHPKWNIGFEVSHDGKFLHIFAKEGCHDSAWFYADLTTAGTKDKLTLKAIYEKMDSHFEYITNNGDIVYFRTNLDAKNYRVTKLDIKNPSKENWVDVVPNHSEDVLDWAEVYTVNGQDYILLNFMRKVVYYLELHKLEGDIVKKFKLPLGTIAKYSGRREDGEFFFQFTSFLTPGQTYHFDLKNLDGDARLIRQSLPKNFDASQYIIEQVFYSSKDGTEVPMFIVRKKDFSKNGTNPCLLYGYGGFNIQITSAFNINRIAWLKNFNGVFAVANIRGGGELGQDWHDSGRLLKKQNCFDDFIGAAEFLIKNKYTNRDKLAIEGGSNGGLLVAAVSNQRPDLFGATICHVGVLDMVRFPSFTIGHAWTSDYGDPKEKIHFENIIKYSPYHNIPETADKYPSTLLLTADHDDRVVPAHSLKFIAQLQHKLGEKLKNTPLLVRVYTKAGHGAGRPVSKVIDEFTDIYSFLYNALDLEKFYNDS